MINTIKKNTWFNLMLLAIAFISIFSSMTKDIRGQQTNKLQDAIDMNGKVSGGRNYSSLVKSKYGTIKKRPAVSSKLLKAIQKRQAVGSANSDIKVCSQITQTVNQPEGFGQSFRWCDTDEELLLVVFINAADNTGVSIEGVKAGDFISVTSASGIASFSKDNGNPLVSSLIGLAAIGVKGVGLYYAPEFVPLIAEAEELAKDQFKATNAKTKRRDASGVDPGTGHKARQEGGFIVTLPSQGGAVYSGNSDHRERWIKANEPRKDELRPSHAVSSFFFIQGNDTHNKRQVRKNGQIYILPWDWKFEDNAGYYKLYIVVP